MFSVIWKDIFFIIYTDMCASLIPLLLFFLWSKMRSRSDALEVIETEMADARTSK